MLTFEFQGDLQNLKQGIELLLPRLSLNEGKGGYLCTAKKSGENGLSLQLKSKELTVTYGEPCHFFRALGLAVEHITAGETSFSLHEVSHFTMNGPMFDVSQGNAAFSVASLQSVLLDLALMGLNTLMIYCEDSYEVKNQPYFGYMRARYTEEEMRRLDDFAYALGIEMIPCIQTLAHMPEPLRWKVYKDIVDYEECLLVGKEETYRFVEDLITSASRPFRSKKIHIGMDEAFKLGRGNYLTQNGYRTPGELMKEHLARVCEITKKLGLEPMMWDDMFFRSVGDGSYYQQGVEVPLEIKEGVPSEITCVYWDYYHLKQEEYEGYLKSHLNLSSKLIFAGGVWTWMGYACALSKTLRIAAASLGACKKLGLKKVFMTTWGDNGTECLLNTTLIGCQIFAEHQYADRLDEEKLAARFRFCTGGNLEDFKLLEKLDRTPDTLFMEDSARYNPSKYLMWQDILTGLADKNIEGVELDAHYKKLAAELTPALSRNGQFNGMFAFSRAAAHVLAKKSEMGLRLTAAYKAGDRAKLQDFAENELPELAARVSALREIHRENWFALYKPFGWDIMDMRYGSLLARIDSAVWEIKAYLNGELPELAELEAERLYYNGRPGPLNYMNFYGDIVSPSRIAPKA